MKIYLVSLRNTFIVFKKVVRFTYWKRTNIIKIKTYLLWMWNSASFVLHCFILSPCLIPPRERRYREFKRHVYLKVILITIILNSCQTKLNSINSNVIIWFILTPYLSPITQSLLSSPLEPQVYTSPRRYGHKQYTDT